MASIFDYANPVRFEKLSNRVLPWASMLTAILFLTGLYFGLLASPADYQQGESVRIMYVHVPAAWMALCCYSAMAIASGAGFIWKHPLADIAAKETAPIGAAFTFLALFTGSLWGKPMWGTWWAWDARLTSMLVLFFLYIGYITLWQAIADKNRAAKLAAILAIVGFVNVPIIKFSVNWWTSLHQLASIIRADGPKIHPTMLIPLFLMIAAYMMLYIVLLLLAMRNEMMERRLTRLLTDRHHPSASLIEE